jgi:hypothetical protein
MAGPASAGVMLHHLHFPKCLKVQNLKNLAQTLPFNKEKQSQGQADLATGCRGSRSPGSEPQKDGLLLLVLVHRQELLLQYNPTGQLSEFIWAEISLNYEKDGIYLVREREPSFFLFSHENDTFSSNEKRHTI